MIWFEGSIVEAISTSKQKKAIFVVYIEGTDDASTSMGQLLNSSAISSKLDPSHFVSIKLIKDSEGHKQFAAIYQLVPVPSLFFISQNGEPLEIVAGNTNNAEPRIITAIEKCNTYLRGLGVSTKAAGDISIDESKKASTSEETKPLPENNDQAMAANTSDATEQPPLLQQAIEPEAESNLTIEDKVERAKQLIIKKNELKKLEEQQKEKESEMERRRVGQELQKAKQMKYDLELKQMKEEREREKKEEADAKKRILEQIAQDRAERLQRLNALSSAAPEPKVENVTSAPPPSTSTNANIGRLQFKLPTGEAKTHSFPADTTLGQVRQFIDNNIVLPFSEYHMATVFPRREFTHRDNNLDLRTLHLLPSAVILILPVTGAVGVRRGPSWSQVCLDMFWNFMQPIVSVSRYIRSYIFGHPPPETTSQQQQSTHPINTTQSPTNTTASGLNPGTGGIKRRGNIHTLADDSEGNDENNTWNGNSTQQM